MRGEGIVDVTYFGAGAAQEAFGTVRAATVGVAVPPATSGVSGGGLTEAWLVASSETR